MLCADLATVQSLQHAFRNQSYQNKGNKYTKRSGRIFQCIKKPNPDGKQAGQNTEKDQEAFRGAVANNAKRAFGLVHGLGFAGALAEVGLPQQEIPLALLMFNVGVETGQILFVCAMLLVIAVFEKVPLSWPRGSWRLLPYTIGSIAAFWIVQRIDSFI